jgi:hypothetical protein
VELYPHAQRPGRVENVVSRVNGRVSEAETEVTGSPNNNNAQSVVNSNHDVPKSDNSSGDLE